MNNEDLEGLRGSIVVETVRIYGRDTYGAIEAARNILAFISTGVNPINSALGAVTPNRLYPPQTVIGEAQGQQAQAQQAAQ